MTNPTMLNFTEIWTFLANTYLGKEGQNVTWPGSIPHPEDEVGRDNAPRTSPTPTFAFCLHGTAIKLDKWQNCGL